MSLWEMKEQLTETKRLSLDDPVYTKRQRVPRYNGEIDVYMAHGVTAGRILRQRLPGWSKGDHFATAKRYRASAQKAERDWAKVANQAAMETWGRKWNVSDYQVSGIGSNEFPEKYKKQLRKLARDRGKYLNLAQAHEDAGKYMRRPKTEEKDMRGDEYLSDLTESVELQEEMDEKTVARKMKRKGYEYILIIPGIKPLYTKTISHATSLAREDYKDKRVNIKKIDRFLGEDVMGVPMKTLLEGAERLEGKRQEPVDEAWGQPARNDEEALYDELMLVAENDGDSYRKKDAKGAVDKAARDYVKTKMSYLYDMLRKVKPKVARDLARDWANEE